jgi:hypothetical protein
MVKLGITSTLLVLLAAFCVAIAPATAQTPYLIGDANWSYDRDIDDVVYIISYIFSGGLAPTPCHIASGDANWSYAVDIDDVVFLIAYIFTGGPPPPTAEDWIAPPPCLAGDADDDGTVDVNDMAAIIACLNDPEEDCLCCGDANADGWVDEDDVTYIEEFLFNAGPEPLLSPLTLGGCVDCMPGDANKDGNVDATDAVEIINCRPIHCNCCADANGDGIVTIEDAELVTDFVFSGRPKPVPSPLTYEEDCVPCLAGDASLDGNVSVGDMQAIVQCLIDDDCICCADANGDAVIDEDDITYLEDFLFVAGPPPVTSPLSELGCIECLPGDVDKDGDVDAEDVQALVNCPPDDCPCCADVNGDGEINLADVVYLTDYVFNVGPEPVVSPLCFE